MGIAARFIFGLAVLAPATLASASPMATDLHPARSTLLITELGSESNVLGIASPTTTDGASVPEPASTGLLVLGLAGLAYRYRRHHRVAAR